MKLGGTPLPGSPFDLTVAPAETDAARCAARGLGAEACEEGEPAYFEVQTRDMHDNDTAHADDMLHVVVKGGGREGLRKKGKFVRVWKEAEVRRRGGGLFGVTYDVPIEGAYSVHVTHATQLQGPWAHTMGSPFQVIAGPSPRPKPEPTAEEKAREARLAAMRGAEEAVAFELGGSAAQAGGVAGMFARAPAAKAATSEPEIDTGGLFDLGFGAFGPGTAKGIGLMGVSASVAGASVAGDIGEELEGDSSEIQPGGVIDEPGGVINEPGGVIEPVGA